jgi:hypothetical protein
MRYEFDIDWHDVEDISDDVLKELLPKDDDLVRRKPCLIKRKNGEIEACYIESSIDIFKVNEQFNEPHPFRGFKLSIVNTEGPAPWIEDEESVIQYFKNHKFIIYKNPYIQWKWKRVYEDIEMVASIPDNTILKDIIRQFL